MGFLKGLVENIPDNYQQSVNDNFPVKKEILPNDGKRKRHMYDTCIYLFLNSDPRAIYSRRKNL